MSCDVMIVHCPTRTCFNQIDCPDYPTEAEFISKFMTALYECGTFDFA